MTRFLQGKFKPKHPEKYKGNPTNIFYRSSWEFSLMHRFDSDSNVEWWNSEEVKIPYNDPTRSHHGMYHPDFLVKYRVPNQLEMIEVKPRKQTVPPQGNVSDKKFIKEALTYAKNIAKWEAAKRYCAKRGINFKIITEDHLFKNGRKP